MPHAASSSARARKSRRSTWPPPASRFRMVISVRASIGLPATAGSDSNLARAVSSMSRLTCVGGRKLPRSTSTAFLRSTSLGCSTSRSGPNIATPLSPTCTSLSAISRLSTPRNSMPRNWIMSISMRPVDRRSSRLSISRSGSCCWKNAPYSRFTPTMPSASCCSQASTSSIRTCITIWLGPELHAHPAVALVAALEAARHDRVGEREEAAFVTALMAEPLHVQLELGIQHALEPADRDVPVRLAVLSVAHGHVVGRDRLRDGARGATDPEEPAHDLLTRPDLGDRPVPARIEVDAQGLLVRVGLVRVNHGLGHPAPCLGHQLRPAARPERVHHLAYAADVTDFAASAASTRRLTPEHET